MKKFSGIIFLLVAIFAVAFFFVSFKDNFQEIWQLPERDNERENLSVAGIIELSNLERVNHGLKEFSENNLLNEVAKIKAEDMASLQYFAHESPSGEEAGDLAVFVGYDFIAVGENLAKGDFISNNEVVMGWMESPGHRENILHSGYTEIGVAVQRTIYEGTETWLAVQIFALPAHICPKTDETLFNRIESKQSRADDINTELIDLRNEIESSFPRDRDKIAEYNEMVSNYNNLLDETRGLVAEYNRQVDITNKCIDSYGF